jgi:SAM-dependent methyltransferase
MPERSVLAGRARALAVRAVKMVNPDAFLLEEGPNQLARLGHRAYVGGRWDEVGQAQLDFLIAQGLRPDHVLLDVACGSLRLGARAIRYLDPGHYLGLDREGSLIEVGIKAELPAGLLADKRPEFVVTDTFEVNGLSRQADFAMACSLFSHLVPADIDRCLQAMRLALKPDGRFFATFIRRPLLWRNPTRSNAFAAFAYSRSDMRRFGQRNGFRVDLPVPDWPGEQEMAVFRIA